MTIQYLAKITLLKNLVRYVVQLCQMMFNENSFEIKRKKLILKNKQEIILLIILQNKSNDF